MPATMIIKANNMFTIEVNVSDLDGYSDSVQLKLEHNYGFGKVHRTDEIFLTPLQMDLLGRFLIRRAEELNQMQLSTETI